jgi:hypothetical protein
VRLLISPELRGTPAQAWREEIEKLSRRGRTGKFGVDRFSHGLLAHSDDVAAKRKLARTSQDFERPYLCTDGRGINKFQRVSCSDKRIQKSLSIIIERADEFGHKFKKNPLRLVFTKAGHYQRFSSLDVYFSHIRAQPETAKNFIGPPHWNGDGPARSAKIRETQIAAIVLRLEQLDVTRFLSKRVLKRQDVRTAVCFEIRTEQRKIVRIWLECEHLSVWTDST